MVNRLGFYNPSQYPVQSEDLIGSALQAVIENVIVGQSLSPVQSPILAAMPKAVVQSDVLRWQFRAGDASASVGALEAPALYSNFPSQPDNGSYNYQSLLPLELTIGQNKVHNVVRINSEELNVALADASTGEISNLFTNRFQLAIAGIIKHINQAIILGGTGSFTGSPIKGLEHIFAANSYAGLVHKLADYTGALPGVDYFPDWRPTAATWVQEDAEVIFNDGYGTGGSLKAATTYTLSQADNGILAAFRNFYRYLMNNGKTFNAILVHPDVEFAYSSVYDMKTNIQLVNGQMSRAEAGFQSPSFMGMPLITDVNVPLNTAYFIDTNKVRVLTKAVANLPSQMASLSQPFGNMSLTAGMLAVETVAVSRFEVYCLPQLQVIDTTGISKLTLDAVDILANTYTAP